MNRPRPDHVVAALEDLSQKPDVLSGSKLLMYPTLLVLFDSEKILDSSKQAREHAEELAQRLHSIAIDLRTKRRIGIADTFLVTFDWMDGLSVLNRIHQSYEEGGYSERSYYGKKAATAAAIAQALIGLKRDLETEPQPTHKPDERFLRLKLNEVAYLRAQTLLETLEKIAMNLWGVQQLIDLVCELEWRNLGSEGLRVKLLTRPSTFDDLFLQFLDVARLIRDLIPYSYADSLLPNSMYWSMQRVLYRRGDMRDWSEYILDVIHHVGPLHKKDLARFLSEHPQVQEIYENLVLDCVGIDERRMLDYLMDAQTRSEVKTHVYRQVDSLADQLHNFLGYIDLPRSHFSSMAQQQIASVRSSLSDDDQAALIKAVTHLKEMHPGHWQYELYQATAARRRPQNGWPAH